MTISRRSSLALAALSLVWSMACSSGGSGSGGTAGTSNGGDRSGGTTAASGGNGSAGAAALGGNVAAGGAVGSGGSIVPSGGNGASGAAAGGAISSGGAKASGGAVAVGGAVSSGGGHAGGAIGSGGAIGAGGAAGVASTGGTNAAGGAPAAGGSSGSSGCGAGDSNLPAEPVLPPACTTIDATQNVSAGGVPSETSLDTSAIQSALTGCGAGKAVKLVATAANNALVTGPLTIPSGVSLWVDAGVTLYATRNPSVWGSAAGLISVTGANSGIYGDGAINGQGGEPNIGSSQSWWDQNAGGGGNSPALISVRSATNFTLYRISLHDSPKFHVKLAATGFVVWGVTIKTPSKSKNSAGTALSYDSAHNTDGIDPGEAASNGTIACSKISTGDDHIAIKGSSATGVSHLTIAHNRFGAGHGMSIGSEFTGGVSDVKVYDLSIDGQGMGTSGGSSNGIRIKSDPSRGGVVNNVTYTDICVRNVSNPILLTPHYSSGSGSAIPQYTNIKIQDFHSFSGSNKPTVTLDGYDSSHLNSVTLDNVVVDGLGSSVAASYTTFTLGPGNVSFTPSGTGVTVNNTISGASTPNPCTDKWTTF